MFKIAHLVWMVLGTVFAGAAIVVVLAIPALASQEMRLLPLAALGGLIVAIPVSWLIARTINRSVPR